ncbi:MAG: 4-oxalocrotonate tautomerase [Pseudomonadota bacterium]
MPLYNLACARPLEPAQRQAVATAITEAHCSTTGAPAAFVNVVFLDHYPLPAPQVISLLGGVRTGGNRTAAIVEKLRRALHTGVAAALDVPAEAVGLGLIGVPSNWVVEGGEVMPEPGAEAEWLARQHAPDP